MGNVRAEAQPDDAEACGAIYGHYVLHTPVSFELVPPDPRRMAQRIAAARERHAWLVAVVDERVVGYAYATPFADRPAYRWSCELSLYVDPTRLAEGIGRPCMRRSWSGWPNRACVSRSRGSSSPTPPATPCTPASASSGSVCCAGSAPSTGRGKRVAIHELEVAPASSPPDDPH